MDWASLEQKEGVRLSWNTWPASRIDAARLVLPLGAVVSPARALPAGALLPYAPVLCGGAGCGGALNAYATLDFHGFAWACPLCHHRNQLPPHYRGISPQSLPAELFADHPAVEYTLPEPAPAVPPAVLFVVDVAVPAQELADARAAVSQVLALLPPHALVGLVSFGSNVTVHELGHREPLPRDHVVRGDRETPAEVLKARLGIGSGLPPSPKKGKKAPAPAPVALFSGTTLDQGAVGRFLLRVEDGEFALQSALDDLLPDPLPQEPGHRRPRATGAAVATGVALLESACAGSGSRLSLLVGGPSTVGPGMIVDTALTESIRTHQEFVRGMTKRYKDAFGFFDALGQRMIASCIAFDVYACCLDQCGLAEMRPAVEPSGGIMVMAEMFSSDNFRATLRRMYEPDPEGCLPFSFDATLQVVASREVKVCGAIGPVTAVPPTKEQAKAVSETDVGWGGGTTWTLASLTPGTSVAVYLENSNQHNSPVQPGSAFFLQFHCRYRHSSGQRRLRVMTVARTWAPEGVAPEVAGGFDQEAAAVLMARWATFRADHEEEFDILRWLDRILVRFAARFADYEKDRPETFRFGPAFGLYPQFMFNLRRSQFLQVFNNAPDETAYYRQMVQREDVGNTVLMIQPTLITYGFDGEPQPALLDVSAIVPDRILVLDTFFLVLVQYGTTIAQWREAGYHTQPEHEAFRALLDSPLRDAKALVQSRCPTPILKLTDQGGSQARFLLAKLNPSVTHANQGQLGSSECIFTDDVSLETFMHSLAKLAVQG